MVVVERPIAKTFFLERRTQIDVATSRRSRPNYDYYGPLFVGSPSTREKQCCHRPLECGLEKKSAKI